MTKRYPERTLRGGDQYLSETFIALTFIVQNLPDDDERKRTMLAAATVLKDEIAHRANAGGTVSA